MRKSFVLCALLVGAAIFTTTTAEARHCCRSSFGISFSRPAPVYYAPAPVVYNYYQAPQPVYVQQQPVYVQPTVQQVIVAQPAYYAPVRPVFAPALNFSWFF